MSKNTIRLLPEDIKLLANYAHWIPMLHGYTREFMDGIYPGWEWNELIPKMLNLGILRIEPQEGDFKLWQGLWLKAGIEEVVATKNSRGVKFRINPDLSDVPATVGGV